MSDVLDLPFDQFQRYELVRALLESVRVDGQRLRILDVGGRTALLREFLPSDHIELVDVVPSDVEGLVLGSGAQLPFKDGAFDAVCAFDTLEHVPSALRDGFVRECARVADRYVILAGPYDSPRVAEAEEALLDFLRARLDWEHQYLLEHRENGLPSMPAALEIFEEAGARTATVGHGELGRWLALMCVELYIEHETLLKDFAPQLYRFYNEYLFPFDHGEEVYRHAVIAAFGDAPMPSADAVLGATPSPLNAADGALLEAGRELLRYDSLRDTYLPEMERLHGVVASMEQDLEGHRREAEDLATDLAGHAETVKALREEGETSRRDAEAERAAFGAERAAFEAERADAQELLAHKDERIGALTADLEGHRLKLGELERLRALELQELEVRGVRLGEVNRELTKQNEIVRRAHEQLDETVRRIEEFVDREARARGAVRLADDCAETLSERLQRAKGRELSLEEEIEIIIGARDLRLAERNQAREAAAQAEATLTETRATLSETRAALSEATATIEQLEGDLAEAEGERKLLREESQRLWNRLGRTVVLRWLTGARKLG
jgi:hypothetical protein